MPHVVVYGARFEVETATNSKNYDCRNLSLHHSAVTYDSYGEFYGETLFLYDVITDATIAHTILRNYFHVKHHQNYQNSSKLVSVYTL